MTSRELEKLITNHLIESAREHAEIKLLLTNHLAHHQAAFDRLTKLYIPVLLALSGVFGAAFFRAFF